MDLWSIAINIILLHLYLQLTSAGKVFSVHNYRRLNVARPSAKVHRLGNTYIFPVYRSSRRNIRNCYMQNNIRQCCAGWSKNDDGTCSPICSQNCVRGKCVAPDMCRCDQGYTGKSCSVDLNECGLKPRPCDQRCTNTMGSFKCYCERGFLLLEDGRTCVHDSRCFPGRCTHGCEIRDGNIRCMCPDGLRANGKFCDDIDECAEGLVKCPDDQECHNTYGNYICLCKPGFQFRLIDGKFQCEDTGCKMFGLDCHEFAQCELDGQTGAQCVCNDGYWGDGLTCLPADIRDCSDNPCYPGVTCTNEHEDIDEVSGYPALGIFEQFTCGPCSSGYEGDGITCEDINECENGMATCPEGAECINLPGSHRCECVEGYYGNGAKCVLVSGETCDDNPCFSGVECVDQPLPDMEEFLNLNLDEVEFMSLFKCLPCPDGYVGDGVLCEDINECEDDSAACHEEAECINEEGSFQCRCLDGFFGNGDICVPVDEMTCDDNPCFAGSQCERIPYPDANDIETLSNLDIITLFECGPCPPGFVGDGLNCTDINECEDGSAGCPEGAECINEEGSFQCRCLDGFYGNGDICVLVEEMTCDDNPCFAGSQCERIPYPDANDIETLSNLDIITLFACGPCPSGFVGDGINCTDINECEDGSAGCTEGAECINEEGSFQCRCLNGFFGNGDICILVEEMTCDDNPCFAGSQCERIPYPDANDIETLSNLDIITLFECGPCPSGFLGNGIDCADINECDDGPAVCPFGADCVNDLGSFHCECSKDFFGDGEKCVPVSNTTCDDTPCYPGVLCLNLGLPRLADLYNINDTIYQFECGPCPPGFIGDGINCDDINECETGTGNCDMNADCENNAGGYACICSMGFLGNGTHCAQLDARGCDDDPCFVGVECMDIDINQVNYLEDLVRLHECGLCPDGFIGDGRNCTREPVPLNVRFVNLTVIVHQQAFSEFNPLLEGAIVTTYLADPSSEFGTVPYQEPTETGIDGIAYVECPHNETIIVTAKSSNNFMNSATFRCNFGQTNVVMLPLHTPYEDTTYLYRPRSDRNFGIGNETLGTRYEISFPARSFYIREGMRIRLLFRAINTSVPEEVEMAPEMIGLVPTEESSRGDVGASIGANPTQLHAIETLGAIELTVTIANSRRIPRIIRPYLIKFPVQKLPAGLNEGDMVPAWTFKEDAGVWIQDGSGVLQRDEDGHLSWNYLANHLSWWAAGRLRDRTSCVNVRTCYDEECTLPARDILLRVYGVNHGYEKFRYTSIYGDTCIQFPFGSSIEISNPCSGMSVIVDSTQLPSSCENGDVDIPGISDDQLLQRQDVCKDVTLIIPEDTFSAVCSKPPEKGEGTILISNPYVAHYYKYQKSVRYECDGSDLAMVEGDGYSVCDRCGNWLGSPVCATDFYY